MPTKKRIDLKRKNVHQTDFEVSTPEGKGFYGRYSSGALRLGIPYDGRGSLGIIGRQPTYSYSMGGQGRLADIKIDTAPYISEKDLRIKKSNRRSLQGRLRDLVNYQDRGIDIGFSLSDKQVPKLIVDESIGFSPGEIKGILKKLKQRFPKAETVKLKKREFPLK